MSCTRSGFNIAFFHYQVGGTDEVSLEIDKWKRVLEEMVHKVYLCACDLGKAEGILIEEMYNHGPMARKLDDNCFRSLSNLKEDDLSRELYGPARVMASKIKRFVCENRIDLLIPQNVWSVAMNPAVASAMVQVVRELGCPSIAHHHDFYWERSGGISLTCAPVLELADKYLPLRDRNIYHVVIKSLAQQELWERKGIQSLVVPPVLDFSKPERVPDPWERDDYNYDFHRSIGLAENDVLILQATGVVARKGIELAIDWVKPLDTPERRSVLMDCGLNDGRVFGKHNRIVLALAGYTRDDISGVYIQRLEEKIQRNGVDAQRSLNGGHKIFSLWDTCAHADFVTYPSLWEGWGNQFLEAIRARLTILLFESLVYWTDIKGKGFNVVSLGSDWHACDDAHPS